MRNLLLLTSCFLVLWGGGVVAQEVDRPNIILIITDDQGFGDLGVNGNHHLKTPTLDQLASESIRFENFYVSPVCAPTRSSLMTGRYSLRTGVRDTYNGGATMSTNETTIAELLQPTGYRTGIFGKWHLGDNYPSRPMDQGFEESVVHLSGGMGQVGDFTTYFARDSSYFNPVLWHNGQPEAYTGYCSDIFTDEALNFITDNQDDPFFCYLSFNAPHTPLQLPEEYYEMYRDIDPSTGFDAADGPFPEMNEKNKEDARKVYGMVTNIDDNVNRLLTRLKELELEENTVIIFMTDNGPQQKRYVAGMRGRKGSVYRGGVRVPLYIRQTGRWKGRGVGTTAAHLDILPTIADLTGSELPRYTKIDGRSLLPLINEEAADWPERSLFFYWTRRYPELYQNIALQRGDHKLVGHTSYDAEITDFELFDLSNDPYEEHNLVEDKTDLAASLRRELDATYAELMNSPNLLEPPLVEIGNERENPSFLNRNDASGQRGIWAQEEVYGNWMVRINPGVYHVSFKFIQPVSGKGTMLLETDGIVHRKKYDGQETEVLEMKNVTLPALEGELIPTYFVDGKRILPFWVKLDKVR